MGTKLPYDAFARGVTVFQNLDREIALVEIAAQIGMEMIHVVETAGQFADFRRIVVDADEQRKDSGTHVCGSPQEKVLRTLSILGASRARTRRSRRRGRAA